MHAAAADYEAHGQIVGSNRRFLLARLEGGVSAKRPGGVVPATYVCCIAIAPRNPSA